MMCQTQICEKRVYELEVWQMPVSVEKDGRAFEWHHTISFKQITIYLVKNEQSINLIVEMSTF